MTSDPDKQAVYYAESVTFDETLFTEPLHTNEITELAYRLFSHSWWTANSIPVPMIKPTTGSDTSSYARIYHPHSFFGDEHDPTIHISPFQIDAYTLAHEATHVAQYHVFPLAKNPHIQAHGEEFRATYLIVTSILFGYDVTNTLAANFSRFLQDASWENHIFNMEVAVGENHSIYQKWRLSKALDSFAVAVMEDHPTTQPIRINGAIAL